MFNKNHYKKKKHNKWYKSAVMMLGLTLSSTVMSTVGAFVAPQAVYADPASNSNSDNSNNNSNNGSNDNSNNGNGDNSQSNSDQPTTKSNDELQTGVSKDKKGNDLVGNLNDARNDLYNSHFPSGVRDGLLQQGGVLQANEGMQLLITYGILKGQYGNGNYHTLMNGTNNDNLTGALNTPDGISIKLPKGFGNQELLDMLNANSGAKDGILKDNKGAQTEAGATQPSNKTKNQNDDSATQKALEPVATVLAQNYIKGTALPTNHPAQYSAGDGGAIAILPTHGKGGSNFYTNGRSAKATPPKAVVKAFEKAILETNKNGSLASLKGKNDKETKENIIKYLSNLNVDKVIGRSSANIDEAIGEDKMPIQPAVGTTTDSKNIGDYGITYHFWNKHGNQAQAFGYQSWLRKHVTSLLSPDADEQGAEKSAKEDSKEATSDFVAFPITKNGKTGNHFDPDDWKKTDSYALAHTQYLTPKDQPLDSFNSELSKGWCANYKRYLSQSVSSSGLDQKTLEKKMSDKDIDTLVKGSNDDAKLAKDTAKATKGLALLGWDFFTPYSMQTADAGNISTTNFKMTGDGKFVEAGNGADNGGKPFISQVQNFFVGMNGKKGFSSSCIYKLYDPHTIQFKFGYNQSVGGKREQTLGDMVGYTNANNGFIQSIKNNFNGKIYMDNISVDDINNGSGKDKDFNQAISAKEQRLITSTNTLGGIGKDEATDAIGFDNYGDIIDGAKAKVLVPYWQNTMLPQFSSFANSKSSGFVANPVMNDSSAVSKMDGMKGVFGDGKTTLLVGKVTKKQIGSIAKAGTTAYNNAVAVSKALGHGGIKDASDYIATVNKAVGDSGKSKLSDKACQALAIDITAGTSGAVQAWNQQFLAMTGKEKHLYIGNSVTDNKNNANKDKKSKYSNLFTVTDIIQYLGLFFQRGGALVLRKTIVGLIANTYNSSFGQNQSQNIFYTPTFNFLSLFYSMPYVFAFVFAVLLILIVVITYIEYAFVGNFGKMKVVVRFLMLICVVPYFLAFHAIEMELLNTPSEIVLSRPLKMESIVDQYANVREEGALKNVFYSALFGDKFTQINKSTSYAIPFYTTTEQNGQVDTANGKDASQAMKNMTLEERTLYQQNGFIHAQLNNGNGKLPFGTQYRYKKVYVASSDLLSWAIHMTRQTLSAEGKIGKGSGYYEQPSHNFKPGQEPLFTWLAEDYQPLGTTISSDGKSIDQDSSNLSVALFGKGGIMGYGGGDPTKGAIADRAKTLYAKALAHGYTKEGAAALVGNLDQESAIDPNCVNSIGASGIVQWYKDRNTAMRQAGGFEGGKGNLDKQIDFMFKELDTSYKSVGDLLKKSHNLEECSNAIYSKYEVPGDGTEGIRLKYSQEALQGFAGIKADASASDNSNSQNNNNKNGDSDQPTYDPKDFWEKLNPAEGKMKSAYGAKGGYGASNGQENNNAQYYKDFDHYTEFMVQTNHKATSSAIKYGIDHSTTGGGWLSASQLFLRIWQTTFTTDNNPSGASAMEKYNSLKNFAVAMNGYQNIPTGNAGTGYQGGTGNDAKQFTQFQRNDLIDNLSETNEVRQKINGGFSPNAVHMMGLFNIPQPENDWLNLDSKNSPLNMVLTYYGTYSGRDSRAYDIEKINKDFLTSYLNTYSLVRASSDPTGKDSTNSSTDDYNPVTNTYQEDAFSMAEAQIMALEEFFDINKVAGIKVFPTNYSGSSISLDTFNRILFIPIGEISKELTDNSTYNYDDYNNASPIRMQDNVIEYLSVRNNIFVLFLILIMNFLLLSFGMVIMLLTKYLLPIVAFLSFVRIFCSPKNLATDLKNLLIGSLGLVGILTFYKTLLSATWSYMAMKMNNEYAMAGGYINNHTAINAIVIILIIIWFFKFLIKDWFPMLRQNGFLSLGANGSVRDYVHKVVSGGAKHMPIIPKLAKGLGLVGAGVLGGSLIRGAKNKFKSGMRSVSHKSFNAFKTKMLPYLSRKRQNIKNKLSLLKAKRRNIRALKDGTLLDKLDDKVGLFKNIVAHEKGIKGKLHGLLTASVGTVLPFRHGIEQGKLKVANKGDLVKKPSDLAYMKVNLNDLDENLRKPLIDEIKKDKYRGLLRYDDLNNTVTVESDKNSLSKVGGRSEALLPLLQAIDNVRQPLHKARIVSGMTLTRFNPYETMRFNFKHKKDATRTRNQIESIFNKYGIETPRWDMQDTHHYSMRLTREAENAMNKMDERQRNELLSELQNVKAIRENKLDKLRDSKGKIDKTNYDLFNRVLELGNTGLMLDDKLLKQIREHGMQVVNGTQVAFNNHNEAQKAFIKDLQNRANKVAQSEGYKVFTDGLINDIAQGKKSFGKGNVSVSTNPSQQKMAYRVGNLNKTKENMIDFHNLANLPSSDFQSAINSEQQFLRTLDDKFKRNNEMNYHDKFKAYEKALNGVQINDLGHTNSEVFETLNQINSTLKGFDADATMPKRTARRLDLMFDDLNTELANRNVLKKVYGNLNKELNDRELTDSYRNMNNMQQSLLNKAHVQSDNINQGYTPTTLRAVSSAVGKLNSASENKDTNTITMYFNHNKNKVSDKDLQRLSNMIKYNN